MLLGEPKGPEFDPILSVRHNLNSYISIKEARKSYSLHYSALNKLADIEDVVIIDPIDYLCNEQCNVMDDNLNYYYRDPTHMRPWYVKQSLGYLEQILK